MPTVHSVEDASAVAESVAQRTVKFLADAIATRGEAIWVLAGGTIPPAAGALIASNYRSEVNWSKVSFVIGDERCVPFDYPESSWRAFEQDVFPLLPSIDPRRLLRPPSDQPADDAAKAYERTLRQLPKARTGAPRFDLVWLGMGEDGHTLSLFPDHDSFRPSSRLVIPVYNSPKPPSDRISLTLNALSGAEACIVIAAGAGKAEAIKDSINGDGMLPVAKAAEMVEASGGETIWLLDVAAASLL